MDRRITNKSFERGPLLKIINKQARAANLSEKGRMRVGAALKAGAEHETKKSGLQYGLGSTHAKALVQFPTSKKYADRRKLRPKERAVLEKVPNTFYKIKEAEPKVEQETPPPSKIEPRVVLKSPEPSQPRGEEEAA